MDRPWHWIGWMGAVALLLGCEKAPQFQAAPSGNTIRIGVIAPLSGTDAAKGSEGFEGIETVLRLQPLLANGDRIELIPKDDQDNPVRAMKALRELAQADQVSAIITFSSSGPVLALASMADTHKVPILAALATHPDVTEHNEYISQICFDDTFQGDVAALYVRDELLLDTVAVFSNPDSSYSSNLAAKFERKITSIGGQVTDVVFLSAEKQDLKAVLKKVRDNRPELLYLPVNAEDVIGIIREAENLHWKPLMMVSDGLLATMMARHEDQLHLLDGLLATEVYHNTTRLTPFGQKVRAVYGSGASSYVVLGMEGFAILLDAMNRCSEPDNRECINNQIQATRNFQGVMGLISIDSNGKAHRPLVINTIRKGHLDFVVKVY